MIAITLRIIPTIVLGVEPEVAVAISVQKNMQPDIGQPGGVNSLLA